MTDKCIALLIWNELLKEVIETILKKIEGYRIYYIDACLSSYSQDILQRLKDTDILIAEASRPATFLNAEGFRLTMKLTNICPRLMSLVIFKSLESRFLRFPVFADYSTIHLIPEKLQALLHSDAIDKSIFYSIIDEYPYLKTIPFHKNVSL